MAMAEKFDSLEEHLEKFVENIRQLGIIVSDFQPSSQAGLNQKLYIDQGRNPQLYTKECLERALAKNEQVKGKIDTMKVKPETIGSTNVVMYVTSFTYRVIKFLLGNFQKELINTWNLWSGFSAAKRISACAS
ncbi:hypothetical protein ASZ78_007102 [Callipepla squamata]|uniref:Mediator of RNA polymerase II transcription subunit 10 n=1 Tax=Callipepla squamata TaxID=9009 RepID=A0A226MT07_CALSU|nr:hypothetical protein ASZ78_007102 [Callipepla squamata]